MKIFIVSGFLGAGKTTFIQALSEKTKKQFVIMENEYGETGIDGSLLEKDRLKVWELTEGCICCSLKSDFASSILTIANSLNPEYLIVEPTGVGMLSAVINNIRKIEYEHIQVLAPVTIVDIHCMEEYLKTFGNFYKDQIRNASQIILSKTEEAAPEELIGLRAVLHNLNPQAPIIDSYKSQPIEWWDALLASSDDRAKKLIFVEGNQIPDLENVGITDIRIESIEGLVARLSALMQNRFGTVYRVKGYAPINGQWARFDVVDKQYKIETCHAMDEAKAIVIGKNLQKDSLKILFRE
ncbi:GTP-binding protein [Treponema phagedenis]|uniref:GTP-binding protein n=1 Tax=Treponema phagedenis TaxID=162 RepID=UPI0001F6418A|nr:GTP-binding protein [Treponema phagedenis]EFW38294.1 CobW/P47K family protein [Treponema phagedenis F0421]TYT79332.1 GTP-binding protein [Treponema phagedenis]